MVLELRKYDEEYRRRNGLKPIDANHNLPTGQALRNLVLQLRHNGWTQKEIAEYTGKSLSWVSRLFSKVDEPKTDSRRVYFVQSVVGGRVKIGIAEDPEVRLRAMQTGSPFELRILATSEGGRSVESALHKKFAASRSHGEWFEPCDELMEFIRSIQEMEERYASVT